MCGWGGTIFKWMRRKRMRSGKQPAAILVCAGWGGLACEGNIVRAAKADGGTEGEEARGQTVPSLRAASQLRGDFGIMGD